MQQYYLHDGHNQVGPFSVEGLREKKITRETYVWKEGIIDWVKAGELPELNNLFINTPPPFKVVTANTSATPIEKQKVKETPTEKTGMWIGRNPKLFVLIILIGFASVISYNVWRAQPNSSNGLFETPRSNKSPEELRRELQQKEKENPLDYLTGRISMRENLMGQKVFEGTIANKASTASFKDIEIVISYISKTESVIGRQKFTIYEVVGPQQIIDIKKIKTIAPEETENYDVRISSALPVDNP